jgi:hypothetical protein
VLDPNAFEAGRTLAFRVLSPMDGASHKAMPQHAPSEKWQGNVSGEEDPANVCRNVPEGVSNTANHKVLKDWRLAYKQGLGRGRREKLLLDELKGNPYEEVR